MEESGFLQFAASITSIDFKYKTIDSELFGVVRDPWLLKTNLVSVTWQTTNGWKEGSHYGIFSVLLNDVEGLNSSAIKRTSSYFYGKFIARLALMDRGLFPRRDSKS